MKKTKLIIGYFSSNSPLSNPDCRFISIQTKGIFPWAMDVYKVFPVERVKEIYSSGAFIVNREQAELLFDFQCARPFIDDVKARHS